jgi:hypothetical protein
MIQINTTMFPLAAQGNVIVQEIHSHLLSCRSVPDLLERQLVEIPVAGTGPTAWATVSIGVYQQHVPGVVTLFGEVL